MFRQVLSLKEMLLIKHKFLFVIMNKDIYKYNDKSIPQHTRYYDPKISEDGWVLYDKKIDNDNIIEHKNNNNVMHFTFNCPNFSMFDFYISDDEQEFNDNVEMLRLKRGV